MIFILILMILCLIAFITFSITAYKKKSVVCMMLALISFILSIVFIGVERSQSSKKIVNVVAIEIVRALPDKIPREDAEQMNELISSLSKNQGTIFSWYNDIDLTPLNLENYQ